MLFRQEGRARTRALVFAGLAAACVLLAFMLPPAREHSQKAIPRDQKTGTAPREAAAAAGASGPTREAASSGLPTSGAVSGLPVSSGSHVRLSGPEAAARAVADQLVRDLNSRNFIEVCERTSRDASEYGNCLEWLQRSDMARTVQWSLEKWTGPFYWSRPHLIVFAYESSLGDSPVRVAVYVNDPAEAPRTIFKFCSISTNPSADSRGLRRCLWDPTPSER